MPYPRSGDTALAGLMRDINQSLDTRFRGYDGNSGVDAAAVQNGRVLRGRGFQPLSSKVGVL
jgi:hypothetical protein